MANQERIEELVSEAAFDQLDKLVKALSGTNDTLVKCILSAEQLNNAVSKSGSFKELEATQKKTQDALIKTQKLQDQAVIVEEKKKQAILRTSEAEAKAAKRKLIDEQKIIDKENARIVALSKKGKAIISNSQHEIDAYNNSVNGNRKVNTTINEQNKAYAAASSQASAYVAATKRVTTETLKVSPAAVAAQKSITKLKIQLDSYKAISSNAEDNDILSKFNGKIEETELKIKQLSNVGKTGFDEFGNAIESTGGGVGDAYSKLKELANILPGIGVAGIIAFAAGPIIDYIQTLDLFGKKIQETERLKKSLSDVDLEGTKNAQADLTNLKLLYTAYQSANVPLEQRKKAYSQLQEAYPAYFGSLKFEEKASSATASAYQKLTSQILASARARAASDKISKIEIEKLDREDRRIQLEKEQIANESELAKLQASGIDNDTKQGLARRYLNSVLGVTNKLIQIETGSNITSILAAKKVNENLSERRQLISDNNKATIEQAKLEKFARDQISKGGMLEDLNKPKATKEKVSTAEIGTKKAELKALRDAQKAIVDDEQNSLDLRFDALQNYTEHVKQLNKLDSDEKIKKAKGDASLIAKANAELVTANQKSDIDTASLKAKINKKANDDLKKALEEGKQLLTQKEKDEVTIIEAANNEKLATIELYRAQAAQGVADQYSEGIISKKQYEQQLLDIESQAAKDRIQVEIDGLKQIIEKEKDYLQFGIGTNQQLGADERKLSQLEISLSKLTTDAKIKDKEKVAEAAKRLRDTEIELGREVLSFGTAMVDGMFTRRINAIQGEIDANEVKKNSDIENVNNSVGTEQEKADRIAIINARAAAQQAVLEQQQRQEKVKQAKFDKAASIASIIANTAVAVMKTYAEFGFPIGVPLAVAQGAIGALQIATVLATPIPQFEHGGTMKKTGLAMYGEVGTELMIDPSGQLSLTPDKPTIGQVSAGTQFISNKDLVRMMAKPELHPQLSNSVIDVSSIINSQESSSQRVIKAIKDQKSSNTIITKSGWRNTQSKMNGIDNYLKRNFN